MFVIPVSGAGIGILFWFGVFKACPGLLGTLIKWAVGLFVAYLAIGGTIGFFMEYNRMKKEALKH